jgi:beta-phosphoglucomutase-like phosphatase (HAD superfamily)
MTRLQFPKAVVFDMDGLLFDTETIVREAMAAAAERLGFEVPEPLFLSLIGLSGTASRARMLDHYGAAFDVDGFWAAVDDDFNRLLAGRRFLKAGVVELLDWLDERRIPRAIATSSHHVHVQRNLAIHELTDRFDAVVAHGDCEFGKPDPAPFLEAARRLEADPAACVALEDSFNGIRAASAAGMMTIMVPDLLQPTDDIRGVCVAVARDLHHVRQMFADSLNPPRG